MRLLKSYRWRRRLLWLAAIAVVAGGVTGLVVAFPSGKLAEESAPSGRELPPPPPDTSTKTVPLTRNRRLSALNVAKQFVLTAVARKHVEQSWNLTTRRLREGMSRKEWSRGDQLPIAPYPVGNAKWAPDYSYKDAIGFQIALYPPKGIKMQAQVFLIDLKAVGTGNRRHWLVDQWGPNPSLFGGGGGGGGTATSLLDQVNPGSAVAAGKPREGPVWLLLPLGLLGLVILIPAGFLIFNWYRGRVIERNYIREQRARAYTSSSRPS